MGTTRTTNVGSDPNCTPRLLAERAAWAWSSPETPFLQRPKATVSGTRVSGARGSVAGAALGLEAPTLSGQAAAALEARADPPPQPRRDRFSLKMGPIWVSRRTHAQHSALPAPPSESPGLCCWGRGKAAGAGNRVAMVGGPHLLHAALCLELVFPPGH